MAMTVFLFYREVVVYKVVINFGQGASIENSKKIVLKILIIYI
jgi:hypothetical protein